MRGSLRPFECTVSCYAFNIQRFDKAVLSETGKIGIVVLFLCKALSEARTNSCIPLAH